MSSKESNDLKKILIYDKLFRNKDLTNDEKKYASEKIKKECTKCKKSKLLKDFYKQSRGKLGRESKCKSCKKIETSKYREKNREIINKKAIDRYHKNN